jgi:hypothetical protein
MLNFTSLGGRSCAAVFCAYQRGGLEIFRREGGPNVVIFFPILKHRAIFIRKYTIVSSDSGRLSVWR